MNFLEWLGGGIVDSISNGVNKVSQTFFGSKKERDSQNHQSFNSVVSQYTAESSKENKNILDSLVDGWNRIIRPLIVTIVLYYFYTSYSDPVQFQKINLGLDSVPENMWSILMAIIAFFFGARELHKRRKDKRMTLSDSDFQKLQDRMSKLNKIQQDEKDLKDFREESEKFSDEYLGNEKPKGIE